MSAIALAAPRERQRWLTWLGLVVGGAILLVAIGWAAFPSLFTGYDPIVGVPQEKLSGPSAAHLLGTDQLGRDLFARMVHGTRTSLLSALLAVTIGLGAGLLLGAVAALGRPWLDGVVSRITDLLLAIPELLLAMLLVAVFGFSAENAAVAIGIASVAGFARVARAEILRIKQLPFVEAASLNGARAPGLVLGHILPNIGATLIAMALLRFGGAILGISTLSFLGFGAPPPAPEWGALVAEGVDYFYSAPWLLYGPAAIIVAVVLAVNRLADTLRTWRHAG